MYIDLEEIGQIFRWLFDSIEDDIYAYENQRRNIAPVPLREKPMAHSGEPGVGLGYDPNLPTDDMYNYYPIRLNTRSHDMFCNTLLMHR